MEKIIFDKYSDTNLNCFRNKINYYLYKCPITQFSSTAGDITRVVNYKDINLNKNDVFNAVFVHGNMLGDAMFYGSGAGKLPTASAVVGDIVDAAKHLHVNIVTNWNSTPAVLKPLDEVTGKFFVRIKKEAAEEAKKVFGDVEIISLGQLPQECAFITDEMTQGAFEEKLAQIGDQVLAKIRVKD